MIENASRAHKQRLRAKRNKNGQPSRLEPLNSLSDIQLLRTPRLRRSPARLVDCGVIVCASRCRKSSSARRSSAPETTARRPDVLARCPLGEVGCLGRTCAPALRPAGECDDHIALLHQRVCGRRNLVIEKGSICICERDLKPREHQTSRPRSWLGAGRSSVSDHAVRRCGWLTTTTPDRRQEKLRARSRG